MTCALPTPGWLLNSTDWTGRSFSFGLAGAGRREAVIEMGKLPSLIYSHNAKTKARLRLAWSVIFVVATIYAITNVTKIPGIMLFLVCVFFQASWIAVSDIMLPYPIAKTKPRLRLAGSVIFAVAIIYGITSVAAFTFGYKLPDWITLENVDSLYKIAGIVLLFVCVFFRASWIAVSNIRESNAIAVYMAMLGYLSAIFAFSLIYLTASAQNPGHAFNCKCAMSMEDSLYFSVITMATVGYGDFYPTGTAARVIVATQVLLGVLFNIVIFALLSAKIAQHIFAPSNTAEKPKAEE
jgi:hypothetical protein